MRNSQTLEPSILKNSTFYQPYKRQNSYNFNRQCTFQSNNSTNLSSSFHSSRRYFRNNRRVRFNPNVQVINVESYKRFNIDVAVTKGCSSWDESKRKMDNVEKRYENDCSCKVF